MDATVMTVPEFRTFYDGWSRTEKEYLDEIRDKLKAVAEAGQRPPQRELKVAVDKIMNHISIYHDMKVQAATSETSAVAAGVWNTPLEAGFIWLGGWRPAAAIMLAYSLMGMQIENNLQALLNGVDVPSMAALSHHQLRTLDDLQQNIEHLEEGLSDRLAHLQMMLAGEEITKAACTDNLAVEGVDMEELDKAVDKKLDGLRDVLIDADKLRLDTLHRMVSILTPMQSSQFLVAAIELLVAIRELGVMKLERLGEEGQEEKSNDSEELHRLAAKGQTAILKKLVTSGADVSKPDFDGRTPLHLAASKGHTASISVLVTQGADVNAVDERGTTPIMYALKGGHGKAAKTLLEAGAKVAESEVGVELCRAAASGDLEYLRTLVHSAKCDPNSTDYDQRTPLQLAAAGGIYPAVDILLRAGGNALAEDRHGFTALEEARRANHWLVVELLNKYVPPESRVAVEGRTGTEEDDDMTSGEDSAPMLADGS